MHFSRDGGVSQLPHLGWYGFALDSTPLLAMGRLGEVPQRHLLKSPRVGLGGMG